MLGERSGQGLQVMAERILCSLEIVGDGMPYRGSRLEARARWWGFSVWFWDEHLCRCGKEIGRSYGRYDARKLAAIILDYDIAWLFRSFRGDPTRGVSVTGERGLKAEVLRMAFAGGQYADDWLIEQSDASFEALERMVGEAPGDDWYRLLLRIAIRAENLGHPCDFFALLRRYHLANPGATLHQLYEALYRDTTSDEAERERCGFDDQINFMSRALRISLLPTRTMEGLIVSSKVHALEQYLKSYALRRGQLPTGMVRLRYGGDHILKDAHPFDVDLDKLAAMIGRDCARLDLPASYRMPRRQREPHFRSHIDALVSAFDERFVIDRGPETDKRWWLRWFLQDHVEDYERLPRGRVRAASSQLPLSGDWYDLGEIDFDALRKAAGLADDVA